VWVIDREKIRRNVAQVVDQVLSETMQQSDTATQTRQAVAEAIAGLFKDNANITSPANQVAAGPNGASGAAAGSLEEQIHRLAHVVSQAQNAIGTLVSTADRIGRGGYGGGGGPRRYSVSSSVAGSAQKAVLLEIFKDNLKLHQAVDPSFQTPTIATPPAPAAPAAAAAPEAAAAPPTGG
jgi:hypothetical protein